MLAPITEFKDTQTAKSCITVVLNVLISLFCHLTAIANAKSVRKQCDLWYVGHQCAGVWYSNPAAVRALNVPFKRSNGFLNLMHNLMLSKSIKDCQVLGVILLHNH